MISEDFKGIYLSTHTDSLTHVAEAGLAEEEVAAGTKPGEDFGKETVQLSVTQVFQEPTAEYHVQAPLRQLQTWGEEKKEEMRRKDVLLVLVFSLFFFPQLVTRY